MPEHYTEYDCTGCHSGISGATREDLAHYKIIKGVYSYYLWESPQVERGAQIIKKFSCRRCHSIDKEGTTFASNLDMSIRRLTPEEIADAIINPNDQMPDFRFLTGEVERLVNALLHYNRINPASNMVEVVHFGGGKDTEVFQDKCGGCHMLLSKSGALGIRPLAPFLTGITTEHYPPLDNRTWSRQMLSDWLDNPRKIKPFSTMPLTELTAEEKASIMGIVWEE